MTDDERGEGTLPGAAALSARARAVLDAHWQPEGYTVPHGHVYPHQWLWDSCFHAVIWLHLGVPERAVTELRTVFARQADDGFVPHMTYWRTPHLHEGFWGRPGTSAITQPPMYGHALAELARAGIDVDADVVAAAVAGLRFLLARRDEGGDVVIVHPWESGCDDSPRWDGWCDEPWTPTAWKRRKGDLVASLRFDPASGSPVGSDAFSVASSAFGALVAFNARELATVTDAATERELRRAAATVAARTSSRWDAARRTYRDAGSRCNAVRTLEALLPVLTEGVEREEPGGGSAGGGSADGDARRDHAFAEILAGTAFGGPCGPSQVHRAEPAFDPTEYWRGGTWPQLSYLIWLAARRAGRLDVATTLRAAAVRGAVASEWAEYWDPDSGRGRGAVPQSWTGLVAVMAAAPDAP